MEQIAINILPKGAKPVCHSSQFDEGRQIMFNLFNDDTPYTLSGTETISVLVRKPDGAEVIDSVTNTSDSYVVWDVSAEACELSGVCECELSIVENGILLGSKNFTMKVEEDAYGGRNIEVRTASGSIATFNTNMVEAFKSLKSDITPVQDLHGYSKPWSGGGGKNKLNYNAWKTVTIANGTAVWENNGVKLTATANDCYTQAPNGFPSGAIIPISEGETITLSWEETTNKTGIVVIFPNGTTTGMVRAYNQQVKKLSYTATSGVTYVTFRFGVSNSGTTIAYKNIQIEKGNQATSFEPYSNICPISGFSALNVTRTGKNFCNPLSLENLYSNYDYTEAGYRCRRIQLSPNTTYTLSFTAETAQTSPIILISDHTQVYLPGFFDLRETSGTKTYTTDATGCLYIGLYQNVSDDVANARLADCSIQIELGSQATSFEPYNGQTVTVNFGQTVYGGVADVTNGKVTVTHAYIKGGFEQYKANNGYKAYRKFDLPLAQSMSVGGLSNVVSNFGTFNANNMTQNIIYLPNAGVCYMALDENFNADEIEIVYPLATPIEITTTPENLTALSGQNNVYGDTNGDTTVEYYIEV